MATTTDNYQLLKPTYAEQADIGVINSNMNKIDEIMHSSQISLADAYDSTKSYAEGDKVMYELLMYKCISPTTGVWDASKWERTTASESGGGGSAELDILGEASGAVASFADGASAGLAKCIVDINPVQDLHGYDKPWAWGAGKNKFEIDTSRIGKSYDDNADAARFFQTISLSSGTYTISFNGNTTDYSQITFGKADIAIPFPNINDHTIRTVMNNVNTSLTITIDASYPYAFIGVIKSSGTLTEDDLIGLDIMIENGSQATSYEPYSNICPIIGHTSVTVNISDGETITTKTAPLGQTVYGGQLNVLTGELTIDRYMVVLDGVNRTVSVSATTNPNGRTVLYGAEANTVDVYRAKSLCDKLQWSDSAHAYLSLSEYTATVASGGTSMTVRFVLPISDSATMAEANTYLQSNNYTFVFPLATPQTVQLTPQEVNSLLGQNNISADTGDIDIVYVKASAPIQPNPTGTPTATLKKLGIEGTVFEVPSGGGGSSGGNYSTTEHKTGQKWIDGKDIYVKVMYSVTQVQLIDTVWTNIPWVEEPTNIDLLIDAKITHDVPNNSNNVRFSVVNGRICGASTKTGNFPPTSNPVYVVFQYTKITD